MLLRVLPMNVRTILGAVDPHGLMPRVSSARATPEGWQDVICGRTAAGARAARAHFTDRHAVLHRNGVSCGVPQRALHRLPRIGAQDERLQRCACSDEERSTGRDRRLRHRLFEDGLVVGRPAGLATGCDEVLYVSDDNKGFIYRIAYTGR
jgi:hypothetical protein